MLVNPSIRSRIVLLAALSALAAGGIAGFAGWRAVGRTVEDRLVHDVVENAAGMIEQLSLPLSNGMLRQMSSLLGGELIAADAAGRALASSLTPNQTARLLDGWTNRSFPSSPVVAGAARIAGRAELEPPLPNTGTGGSLFFLVDQAEVRRAKLDVALRIAGATGLAIVAAIVVALLLSRSITAPLHLLAAQMVRISQEGLRRINPPKTPADADRAFREHQRVPAEVDSLRERFEHLLDSLADAQKRLEEATQLAALGKVAVSVAHEVRNPLSGVRMNVRILADECREAGVADESLNAIQREIDRMDLYLEELMSLRPDAECAGDPAPPVKTEPVDLSRVASSVLELLGARCRHAGIETRLEAAPELPPVRADFQRLRQVLINCALNAMDAMPDGGTLSLYCHVSNDERHVLCRVRDTGTGLDAEHADNLFDAFVTTKSHSAGLGLYISRRIVEQHNGTLTAKNTADGAEFTISLPADIAAEK
ncbi:MAG: sensor histidine kinase [Verrucomicrobiota bacterium]